MNVLSLSLFRYRLSTYHFLRVDLCVGLFEQISFRNEMRRNFLFNKSLPVKVPQPDMLLKLIWSVEPKPALRLSLDAFINEISGLKRPAFWNFMLFQLYLLAFDLVNDFFPRGAIIRHLAHHHLISNNADCEVVRREGVVLPAHDLRRHIARRPGCVRRVVLFPLSCEHEIGQLHVAFLVKQDVAWLDIPTASGRILTCG